MDRITYKFFDIFVEFYKDGKIEPISEELVSINIDKIDKWLLRSNWRKFAESCASLDDLCFDDISKHNKVFWGLPQEKIKIDI